MHSGCHDVVTKHASKLVVRHLAEIGDTRAEPGRHGAGVGGRAATALNPRARPVICASSACSSLRSGWPLAAIA